MPRLSWLGLAGLLCAIAGMPEVFAHGSLSMEEDYCKLRVGPRYLMHFVGYQPGSSGPKEFCEDIPDTGRTVVVLDFLQDALRELPTEVRIIRDTGSETDLEAITVFHRPAKMYTTGSLSFELDFKEPGKFVGLVTVTESAPMVARFPFSVGQTNNWLQLLIPVALLIVGALALYRFAMSRHRRANEKARRELI